MMNFDRRPCPGSADLGKRFIRISPPLTILSVICAVALVSPGRAATVLDPDPEVSTTLFGYAIASLGDVNGDGVPDYAVGAPYQDGDFVSTAMGFGDPQNVGKVFVFDGATFAVLSEMTDPEFEVIQDQHFGGQLGHSLSVSADINGDGIADVIVGVPNHIANPDDLDNKLINAGKALVFSGSNGALLLTLNDPGEQEEGHFGRSVAALGDVDGDGVADFAVGADAKNIGGGGGSSPVRQDGTQSPAEGGGTDNVGQVFIFNGKTGTLIRTLDDPADGYSAAGAHFGAAVANAGDLNKDGVTDIVIGAPGKGQVFVFNGKTGDELYEIDSPTIDLMPSFGAALAAGQDFNKDGRPDIVVGAPLNTNNRGAVYVFNGRDGSLIRTLRAPVKQDFAKFGAAVYASPDITGDRKADIIVGAPGLDVNGVMGAGQAYVYDGVRGRLNTTLTSTNPQPNAGFGTAVTSITFSGSQTATPIVGAPYQSAVIDSLTHLQIGQFEVSQ
ncbi:MAG TPA: integrin alpha [Chthoniobacterales bacterium]|nr:integrin alpha [Chthoniobacterales bacterium]